MDPRAAALQKMSHGVLNYDQPHYVVEHVNKSVPRKLASVFLASANGGEYRRSYHGYAPGYALVLNSPEALQVRLLVRTPAPPSPSSR